MDFVRKNPAVSLLVVFVLGLVIGLVVFGWWLFPVQWDSASPDALAQPYQDAYVRAVADTYSFDGNTQKVQEALAGWAGVEATCDLASRSTDPAEQARLNAAATAVNGVGCGDVGAVPATTGAETPAAEEGEGTDRHPRTRGTAARGCGGRGVRPAGHCDQAAH